MKFLCKLLFILLIAFISKSVGTRDACLKAYVPGDCRSASELWVYDSKSRKCVKHHGCYRKKRGHSKTEKECLTKCSA